MNKFISVQGILWIVILFLFISCGKNETLFQQLKADRTGITFVNKITPDDTLNIINYTNMYNGGGVAVADFNNNGLQDIYFTGNMVGNELYLNQGDLQFKNVTAEAGVAAEDRWSSGVAAVDINNDGWMDLYISATTYEVPEQRSNRLFINRGANEKGIPVFEEMAAEYNIADTTNTTMAAFFDYDNDGDLDLYLLVNKFTRNSSMDSYHEKMTQGESVTTDRLYRNEGADSLGHPYFTNVSDEAGILMEGFGLGVNIADINKDGWKDIYVSNDFITNEVVYMNNGDGTFTDKAGEIFKHTVHSGMGNDVADINNDGNPDVIMVDMLPEDNYRKKKMLRPNNYMAYVNNEKYDYDYQYVRNQLHLYRGNHPETGTPLFSDIGIYSGISETDWSWAPLAVDFNNSGWRDIIISNGFPKDVTDHDFESYVNEFHNYLSMEKLLARAPSVKLNNYAFKNNGDLTFENVTEKWGMKIPSFSNGAATADLDNDGDLDYIVNNVNHEAFVFKNQQAELYPENNNYLRVRFSGEAGNQMGLGTIVEITYGEEEKQYYEYTTYRGYLSSVEPVAHFGLGSHKVIKKLTVTWPDGSFEEMENIESNQVLTLDKSKAVSDLDNSEITGEAESSGDRQPLLQEVTAEVGIDYMHQEWDFNDFNIQPLLPHKLSQYGPALAVGDVNSDGLDDIYISGAFEFKGEFLIQQQDGSFNRKDLIEGNNPENREEELGSLFFDADGDGDQDLYIVSGGFEHPFADGAYQDRLFLNQDGRFILNEDALPNYFLASGLPVKAADFDRDGDLDLFVGGRVYPHEYPKAVDSYLIENKTENRQVKFEIVNDELAPELSEIGIISDALWTDFNNDGWVDLLVAGEWMSLRFLKNDHGKLIDVTEKTGIGTHKGWWNSICAGDFDSDGDIDYIAGNLGTNTYNRANEQYPLRIYANDFDNNGRYDAIPTLYYESRDGQKKEVPYHGRQDLTKQLPLIAQKFKTHHDFAIAGIDEILSAFDTTDTVVKEADYMKTSYVENQGDGTFSMTSLPGQVQWSAVYSCMAEDLNSDGVADLILVGNDYGTEVSTGRYDALNGLVLIGNGDGTFEVMNFEESGFLVPGDAKALVSFVNSQNELIISASQNQGPLKLFKKEGVNKPITVQPDDAYAVVFFEDGRTKKKEFYYGSGFLSQSERFLIPPDNYVKIEITNFQGNTRTVTE